jgi:hypothetical protein
MNLSILKVISAIKSEDGYVCEASYKVSYHTAHCGEAHVIAKNLIILCTEIVSCVLRNNPFKVTKKVPLSKSTILKIIVL